MGMRLVEERGVLFDGATQIDVVQPGGAQAVRHLPSVDRARELRSARGPGGLGGGRPPTPTELPKRVTTPRAELFRASTVVEIISKSRTSKLPFPVNGMIKLPPIAGVVSPAPSLLFERV